MQPDKMDPYKIVLKPVEIDRVPYMGFPECKECPEKITTVIERRLYGNTDCVAVDTHLECAKLDFCKNVKRLHLAATMYADE